MEQTQIKPLKNSIMHYGIISLIVAVGILSLVTCIAMMTPQGNMMMGMHMTSSK